MVLVESIQMNGMLGVWKSTKAMFAIIVLLFCTLVALKGAMSPAFAACISSITGVFLYCHSKNNQAAIAAGIEKPNIR